MKGPFDELFKYDLNTLVYFMYEKEARAGYISERAIKQIYHPVDWDYDEPRVETKTVYLIRWSGLTPLEFSEFDFGRIVYVDKQKFIDDCVIIK